RFAWFRETTISRGEALGRELEQIRRQGYSEDNEEFLAGVCCLAVPVRNRRGEVVAGLAVMAPSARLPLDRAHQHLPDLRACADAISAELPPKGRRAAPALTPPTRQRRTA